MALLPVLSQKEIADQLTALLESNEIEEFSLQYGIRNLPPQDGFERHEYDGTAFVTLRLQKKEAK